MGPTPNDKDINVQETPQTRETTETPRHQRWRPPEYPAGQSSKEIHANIDRTRHDMDRTLDELAAQLQPRKLFNDALQYFRSWRKSRAEGDGKPFWESVRGYRKQTFDQIREHPVPTALFTAGIAWLIFEEEKEERPRHIGRYSEEELKPYSGSYVDARTGEPYEESYGEEYAGREKPRGGWTESAKERVGRTREMAGRAGHSIRETAGGAGERISRWGERTRERTRRGTQGMTHRFQAGTQKARQRFDETYQRSQHRVEDAMETHPLAVGTACLALGVLAGMVVPRSRQEDQWMGEKSDQLKQRAQQTGQEAVQKGREVAQETMASAQQAAEREGLTPAQIRQQAEEKASRS